MKGAKAAVDFQVGTLYLEIRIEHSRSLKDKRTVLRSLKDRLKHRHNVSVAEVGFHDSLRDSVVVLAAVAASRSGTRRILESAYEQALRILGRSLYRADFDV